MMLKSFLHILCLMALIWSAPAHSRQTQAVSNPAELKVAFANVKTGGEIALAPGAYGAVELRKLNLPDGQRLTLRSADPTNPARFSGILLQKMRNLTIENVVFDYTFKAGDKLFLRPFQIIKSENITIRGVHFDGDLARGRGPVDNGFPTAFGLGVTGSRNIVVQGNKIHGFHRGLVVSQSRGVTIKDNNVYHIRSDGMNFADVAGLRITGNYIHDFKRSPASKDHSDMIQFWTKNTDNASRDVVIRDNLLSSGTGLYTQSIFMRNDQVDRGLAGAEMFYRNITIENNTIINAHLHGITVGETDGLVIRNNTVVRNKSSKGKKNKPALWTPQIRVAPTARNVEITRNVTSKVVGHEQQAGWRVARNFFVQDTMETQPGFYGAVFGRASMNKPTSPASFTPKPGGPLHNANLGSSLFLPE